MLEWEGLYLLAAGIRDERKMVSILETDFNKNEGRSFSIKFTKILFIFFTLLSIFYSKIIFNFFLFNCLFPHIVLRKNLNIEPQNSFFYHSPFWG